MLRATEEAVTVAGREKVVEPFHPPRRKQAYTGMKRRVTVILSLLDKTAYFYHSSFKKH